MKILIQLVDPNDNSIIIEEEVEAAGIERIPLIIRIMGDEVSEEAYELMKSDNVEGFMRLLMANLVPHILKGVINPQTIAMEISLSEILGT